MLLTSSSSGVRIPVLPQAARRSKAAPTRWHVAAWPLLHQACFSGLTMQVSTHHTCIHSQFRARHQRRVCVAGTDGIPEGGQVCMHSHQANSCRRAPDRPQLLLQACLVSTWHSCAHPGAKLLVRPGAHQAGQLTMSSVHFCVAGVSTLSTTAHPCGQCSPKQPCSPLSKVLGVPQCHHQRVQGLCVLHDAKAGVPRRAGEPKARKGGEHHMEGLLAGACRHRQVQADASHAAATLLVIFYNTTAKAAGASSSRPTEVNYSSIQATPASRTPALLHLPMTVSTRALGRSITEASAAVLTRVVQEREDVHKLHKAAGPAMYQEQGHCMGVLRAVMGKMQVNAVDGHAELLEALVECSLPLLPIVFLLPECHQFLQAQSRVVI